MIWVFLEQSCIAGFSFIYDKRTLYYKRYQLLMVNTRSTQRFSFIMMHFLIIFKVHIKGKNMNWQNKNKLRCYMKVIFWSVLRCSPKWSQLHHERNGTAFCVLTSIQDFASKLKTLQVSDGVKATNQKYDMNDIYRCS